MTEAEVQAVADAITAASKAKRADLFKRAKAFVVHNALGLAVGGGAVFLALKVL